MREGDQTWQRWQRWYRAAIVRYLTDPSAAVVVTDGAWSVIVPDAPGSPKLFFRNGDATHPIGNGKWMDSWEPDDETIFGVTQSAYEQMPVQDRATLEARLQLAKDWPRREYDWLYPNFWPMQMELPF